jgi:hypothetical protein
MGWVIGFNFYWALSKNLLLHSPEAHKKVFSFVFVFFWGFYSIVLNGVLISLRPASLVVGLKALTSWPEGSYQLA